MMTRIIGITGGIATGKSTVSHYLLSLGYQVIDCDLLTRQAYVDCFENIREVFPDCIEDHQVNSQKLGQRVFQNNCAKLKLEKIIHPYCRKKMTEAIINHHGGLLFLDIPLLFEAKMEDLCDEIWVVYVPESLQLKRLMDRNHYDIETAKSRITAQIPIEEKKKWADVVLNNEQSIDNLQKQVQQRLEEYDE